MKEFEALIKALSEATKLLSEYKEREEQRNRNNPPDMVKREYLDSTGAVINQPQVHLMDKKHTVSFPAIFEDGKFYNDESQGDFRFEYEFVKNNYYIAQTGDRIACYRSDCLFNKYKGCTIKPMLTIGANWKVICGSYITKKESE